MLGQGGIGQVWRAFDTHMKRNVAIKVVHERYRVDEKANQRLTREATLTGSLEHPGVPAVHDHGQLADGSGYVVMELVDGLTLAETLAAPTPQSQTRLVGIFSQIAQTIAYAHSQGVIHRDLKPQNIMLGQFGEVQVMDWGMAKLLASQSKTSVDHSVIRQQQPAPLPNVTDPADATTNASATSEHPTAPEALSKSSDQPLGELDTDHPSQSARDTKSPGDSQSLTQAGEVFGTPAYMAPEQARGEKSQIGPPSDVYALGAILFEILTGHRLNDQDGKTLTELDRTEIDAQLAELCRQCLSESIEGRPSDASEVSDRVTAYQQSVESKLKQAQLEQAAAEVRVVEEQKRRATTMKLTAGIASAVALGVLGILYQWNSAVAARDDAEQNRQLAQERFLLAKSTVDEYLLEVSQSRELLASSPGTQALRRTLLEKAKTYYEAFAASQPDSPEMQAELAEAYLALGRIRRQLETSEDASESLLESIDISSRLVEQDFAPNESRLRIASAELELAALYDDLGNLAETEAFLEDAIENLESLGTDTADSERAQSLLAQAFRNLAVTQSKLGEDQSAEETYHQALTIEEKLVADAPDDQRYARMKASSERLIAMYHLERGEYETARLLLDSAMETFAHFDEANLEAESDHVLARVRLTLADVAWDAAGTDEAIEILESSLPVAKRLALQNPLVLAYKETLGAHYTALAYDLQAQDDERCLDVLGEAIPFLRQTVEDHPENFRLANVLGDALSQRAERFLNTERTEEGLLDREESLRIHMRLYESDPSNRDAAVQVVDDYKTVGILRRRTGDPDGAAEAYTTAIAMMDTLEAEGKSNADLLQAKAGVLNNLGFLYVSIGRTEEAMQPYERAAELYGQIAGGDPGRVEYYFQASTLTNIAYAYLGDNQKAEALEYLNQAVDLLQDAYEVRPNEMRVHNFLFTALTMRSDVLNNLGKHDVALEDLDFALKLNGGHMQNVAAIKRLQTILEMEQDARQWKRIVDEAIELAGTKRSDFIVESANVAAKAARAAMQINETSNSNGDADNAPNTYVPDEEPESSTASGDDRPPSRSELVEYFAEKCASQLNLALDVNNFQLFQPRKLPAQGRSFRAIWDHPAMAATVARINAQD